jgi:hypothetical protein
MYQGHRPVSLAFEGPALAYLEDTMLHPRPRRSRLGASTLAASALIASLLPGLMSAAAQADDPTCVGKGEYRKIKGGMAIQKLAILLDGQVPFAEVEGQGTQRVRWYTACDAWQPVKDVKVRYRQPVVGRRTVTGKKLAVYQPEPTSTPGPRGGAKGGSGSPHPSR